MNMILCNSSMIQGFGIETMPGDVVDLTMVFANGEVYKYTDVPIKKIIGMLDADSHGAYFAHIIKNEHTWRKLGYVKTLQAGPIEE